MMWKHAVLTVVCFFTSILPQSKCAYSQFNLKSEIAPNKDVEILYPLSSEEDIIPFSTPLPRKNTTRRINKKPNNNKYPFSPQFEAGGPHFIPNFDHDGDSIHDVLVQVSIRDASLAGIHVATIFGTQANHTSSSGEQFGVFEFKDVAYAEAPVGPLRFQRTVLKQPVDEFEAGHRTSNPCPQLSSLSGEVVGAEDCLQLSIFVPEFHENNETYLGFIEPPEKLPVLVWFHGENPERFQRGKFSTLTSGSSQDLEPHAFLQRKILVVTPQYRLGSLGFLSAASEDLNGNMGLLDQWTALEWVHRFIASFGGDSNQITIMGQGSSAISLGLLATSTVPRGLFHGIILMSGSPASPVAIDSNENLTLAEVARQNSCPTFPALQFVRCMQTKRTRNIILADEQLTKGRHLGKFRAPLPVIQKEDDGRFLPPLMFESPKQKVSKGKFPSVPVIIGVTGSEMSGFLPDISGKQMSEFTATIFSGTNVLRQFIRAVLNRSKFDMEPDMLARLVTFEYFAGLNVTDRKEQAKDLVEELLSDYLIHIPALTLAKSWSSFAPVYFYVFDHVPSPEVPEQTDENHTYGIRQIRRQVHANADTESSSPITQAIHGSDLQFLMRGHLSSSEDQKISEAMVDLWANFIRTGSPSNSEWPQYKENTKQYLLISDRIDVRSKFRSRQELFWTELIKELGTHKQSCQDKSYQKSAT